MADDVVAHLSTAGPNSLAPTLTLLPLAVRYTHSQPASEFAHPAPLTRVPYLTTHQHPILDAKRADNNMISLPHPARPGPSPAHPPIIPPAPARRPFGGSFRRSRARAPVFPCACAVDLVLVDRARSGAVFARWSGPARTRAHTSFLPCASSDLVLVRALGGRGQGHAALRLASSGWIPRPHFGVDAGADQ